MKIRKKIYYLLLCGALGGLVLASCGESSSASKAENGIEIPQETPEQTPDNADGVSGTKNEGKLEEAVSDTTENEAVNENYPIGKLIENQSFDITLDPIGKVTFASYEPDVSKEFLADAVFQIRDGKNVIQVLEGMYDNNIRVNEIYNQVEAVSFTDYNQDTYDDIIVICSYSPSAGPDVGTGYSEVRYYAGGADGKFTLEKKLSQDANAALSKITIQTAKLFVGPKHDSSYIWKQALIEYLTNNSNPEEQEGYTFIYLNDDEIPELVEIGNCEATGTRIVNYDSIKGNVNVTQLDRLYFSYIERENLLCNSEGNMDYYYDLVYSIIDGKMKLIASGYYGAEDNTRLQFDSKGDPIYQYKWEGVLMTKEEYAKQLNKVYDTSKAKESYEWNKLYTRDELIQLLESGNI